MNSKSWKLIFCLCSLLVAHSLNLPLQAQRTGTLFSHFTNQNGLIMNNVEYIHIDMEGFVWMGTYAGLQRFDGYEFKTYTYDPTNPSSISDNFISTIFEDDSANLWIGTSANGLNVFHKEVEAFRNFRHDPGDQHSLASNSIPRAQKVITQDAEGHVWINTMDGLNKIDIRDFSFESYHGDFSGQLVFDNAESALWIAGDQLKKFDLKSSKLSYFESGPVNSIILDMENNLWLGTRSGTVIYRKDLNKMISLREYLEQEEYTGGFDAIPADIPANNFYEDFRGNIWFSIRDRLVNLDKEQKKINILAHEPDNENSPTGASISGIYGNKSGVIWISYLNQGVSKVNINLKNFNVYRKVPGDPNSLSGNTIRSVYLDHKQVLWVGTYDNGLNRVQLETNTIAHYRHDDKVPASIVSDYITAIHIDRTERLWIGSYNKGICFADNIYSTEQLRFKRVDLYPDLEIHEFTEDPAGRIWISTQYGFFIFDGEVFRQYGELENQVQEISDLNIQSVIFEPPNHFWLATWNSGVCKLTINADHILASGERNDVLARFDQLEDQDASPIDNKFITIHRSDDGVIWLGSFLDGLIKLAENDSGISCTKYDKTAGSPDNSVYGLTSDRQGNIWISTNQGLGKFNPLTEQFSNYVMSDGLQSNSFMWDASFRGSDGRLFFGGVNGLNAFFPEEIIDNLDLPKVFITKLILNNEEVLIGDKFRDKVILEKAISYTDHITLSHRESVFHWNLPPWIMLIRWRSCTLINWMDLTGIGHRSLPGKGQSDILTSIRAPIFLM